MNAKKILAFNQQPEGSKRGNRRENRDHVVISAVRVYRTRDA